MFTSKNLAIFIGKQFAVAFIVVGIAFGAVLWLSGQISTIAGGIQKNLQLVQKLQNRTETFSIIAHDVAAVGSSATVIENAFPPADNILQFILALDNMALKNNVTESYHFDTPVSAGISSPFPLSTIGYQNTLSGNITALDNYLKDFEKFPYFTKIDGINFTASGSSGWQNGGTATYRATLYTKTQN